MRRLRWTLLPVFVAGLAGAASADAAFPRAGAVEVQPLVAQIRRVQQAMELLGTPLPRDVSERLGPIEAEADPGAASAAIQDLLDPLCLAAVEVVEGRPAAVTPGSGPVELFEQGWRACLLKVVNRAGATGRVRIASPNARPIPHAPADEVPERWFGLEMYEGRPLRADLGGLELEYRVVQVYGRDAGDRTARLQCRVDGLGPGRPSSTLRRWRFDRGPDGWRAANDVEVEARDGVLRLIPTGGDPYAIAPAAARPGPLLLRFWADVERPGVGQVYWTTEDRPLPDGNHLATFQFTAGRPRVYEVPFTAEAPLTGVRLDPDGRSGLMKIDWIELAEPGGVGEGWSEADVAFRVVPSTEVRFEVVDATDPDPVACFEIRDARGQVYPAQAKRLAPDFFFHPQVYRANGESVRLPAGTYTVTCSRGPESIPEVKTLEVDDAPTTLSYTVRRWVDASSRGWWSGDHHIHAAGCLHYENPTQGVLPEDMFRHIRGEDVHVGCSLNWGPCFDYQKQFFLEDLRINQEQYPYILRNDVEVSGFGSHQSGHLNLLRLRQQIPDGGDSKNHWPTLGMNTLRWAKRQGAITGPAHSAIGLTRFVGRVPGTDGMDGPDGLPHFNIPTYDGIGANEFVVQAAHEVEGPDGRPVPAVDFISTMNTDRTAEWTMWYHVLNCGFRVVASGETDFPCVSGDRVGMGRVYVKLDGRLDYARWVEGLGAGRSYVSDGTCHLFDLAASPEGRPEARAEPGVDGGELRLDRPGKVRVTLEVAARRDDRPTVPVELVVNGYPVATQEVAADGSTRALAFEVEVDRSSWLAARVRPSAHTNPVFVLVDGKPVRASKASAEWCLRGVDQCWSQKERTYAPAERDQAAADYEHARAAYRRIAAESP